MDCEDGGNDDDDHDGDDHDGDGHDDHGDDEYGHDDNCCKTRVHSQTISNEDDDQIMNPDHSFHS